MSEKRIIGITGTMGSGKSSALALLAKHIPVTDCDAINRSLIEPEGRGAQKLLEQNLARLNKKGQIDKDDLAGRMFSNPDIRKEVEGILHPMILEEMQEWIEKQPEDCAVEVPLLFELGLESYFTEIWCTSCKDETALYRLKNFRHIPEDKAKERIAHQYPKVLKEQKSDHVLMNDGTVEELEEQIEKLLNLNLKID